MTKRTPETTSDKPVIYIDDVDVYYFDQDKDCLFWDSDEMPDTTLSLECEYRRVRGVFSEARGPIKLDNLLNAIEAQNGGVLMQPLDAMQAICHGDRRFCIDKTDCGMNVAPQLLALARQTAKEETPLSSTHYELDRERRVSELLMLALMSVLGHDWVDDECKAALISEAASTSAPGKVTLIGEDENEDSDD